MAVSLVLARAVHRTRILSVSAQVNAHYTITSVSGATKSLDRRQSIVQHALKQPRIFFLNAQNLPNHCHMISESRNEDGEKVCATGSDDGEIVAPVPVKGGVSSITRKLPTPAPLEVIEPGGSYHVSARIPSRASFA